MRAEEAQQEGSTSWASRRFIHVNTHNTIHSQHTCAARKLKYVEGNTSHTSQSLHSHARDVLQRVPHSQTRFRRFTANGLLYTSSKPMKTPDRRTSTYICMDAVTTTCSSGTPGPLITATTAQPSSIHRRRFTRRHLGVMRPEPF